MKFILPALFVLASFNSFSQYNLTASQVKVLKSRTVLVVLPEDTISSAIMKNAFEENWTLNDEVLFKSMSESDELIKDNPEDYYKIFLGIEEGTLVTTVSQPVGPDYELSSFVYGSMPKFYIQGSGSKPLMSLGLPSHRTFDTPTVYETVQRMQFILNEVEIDGTWGKTFSKTST
ncbi:MAG: hypothetical protein ACI837_002277 [Crocinitomicaceae bacterium]|jgi:hypothetical protein